jgi:hypothetical protein
VLQTPEQRRRHLRRPGDRRLQSLQFRLGQRSQRRAQVVELARHPGIIAAAMPT